MPARTQVLLAALCFGTTGTAQALGPAGLSPAGVGAARILIGGALLVAFAGGLPRLPLRPLLVAPGRRAAHPPCLFAALAHTRVARRPHPPPRPPPPDPRALRGGPRRPA